MYDLLLSAVKIDTAFFLIWFGITILLIAAALLIKIWRIDYHSDEAKLIRLVSRANKGDLGAQIECDQSPFVNKSMIYRDGALCTRYKVSREVLNQL